MRFESCDSKVALSIGRLRFGWRFWVDFPRFCFTAIRLIFLLLAAEFWRFWARDSGNRAIRDSVPLSDPPPNSTPKFTPIIAGIPLQFQRFEPNYLIICQADFCAYGGDQERGSRGSASSCGQKCVKQNICAPFRQGWSEKLSKAVASRRRKSRSVPEGGADFPAAIFLAGKCPNLSGIACRAARKPEFFQQRRTLPENPSRKELQTATAFSNFLKPFKSSQPPVHMTYLAESVKSSVPVTSFPLRFSGRLGGGMWMSLPCRKSEGAWSIMIIVTAVCIRILAVPLRPFLLRSLQWWSSSNLIILMYLSSAGSVVWPQWFHAYEEEFEKSIPISHKCLSGVIRYKRKGHWLRTQVEERSERACDLGAARSWVHA